MWRAILYSVFSWIIINFLIMPALQMPQSWHFSFFSAIVFGVTIRFLDFCFEK